MNTRLETVKDELAAKKIKPTIQRLAILAHVRGLKTHPTVEQVYERMITEIPSLSKTTVYNTMNIFIKKGVVVPVTITGTELRIDPQPGHHHHFHCTECGDIIDIHIKCPVFSRCEVQGHRISEFHGYFRGTCKSCIRK